MVSMTGQYLGMLRTQFTHLKSKNTIITDAPTDNNGKGEAFSPTDLVCCALSSCMITIMGIVAEREGIALAGLKSEIVKKMSSDPRKISEIQITFSHPDLSISEGEREKLKRAALTCPVALSLSETIVQTVNFKF